MLEHNNEQNQVQKGIDNEPRHSTYTYARRIQYKNVCDNLAFGETLIHVYTNQGWCPVLLCITSHLLSPTPAGAFLVLRISFFIQHFSSCFCFLSFLSITTFDTTNTFTFYSISTVIYLQDDDAT